jgi:predicted Fe-S protein YdhL (DUF1289 family)
VSEPEPLSPCIALCVLDPESGYCRGCFRSIGEIAGWLSFTAAEKRRILAELSSRKRQKSGPGVGEGASTPT